MAVVISADWQPILVVACLVAGLGSWIILYALHQGKNQIRRQAGLPTKTAAAHLRTHAPHHIPGLVLIVLGLLLLAGVGVGYTLLHHGGAVIHHAPLAPPVHRSAGGSTGNYTSPDLAASVRPVDAAADQGDSNSCCAWTMVRLDALNRYLRDKEVVTIDAPISPFKPWWYATGGQNVGTDPTDDATAYNAHGAEGLAYWGRHGFPDSTDAAHTLPIRGTTIVWNYYEPGGAGRAGLTDTEWHLDRSQPVGVLWNVHQGGVDAQNSDYTWDGGSYVFAHCAVIVQYTRNYPGLGEAVRLWNSWGTGWGRGGYIWVPAAVFMSHFTGAFTESPGPPVHAWTPPPPTATPRPTARPTARPHPTATPHPRPTATATAHPLAACHPATVVATRSTNALVAPRKGARALQGLPKNSRILVPCPARDAGHTHWWTVATPNQRPGFVLRAAVRRT